MIIRCPDCKNKFSDSLHTCPKCGRTLNSIDKQQSIEKVLKRKLLLKVFIAIAVLCFLVISTFSIYTYCKHEKEQSEKELMLKKSDREQKKKQIQDEKASYNYANTVNTALLEIDNSVIYLDCNKEDFLDGLDYVLYKCFMERASIKKCKTRIAAYMDNTLFIFNISSDSDSMKPVNEGREINKDLYDTFVDFRDVYKTLVYSSKPTNDVYGFYKNMKRLLDKYDKKKEVLQSKIQKIMKGKKFS